MAKIIFLGTSSSIPTKKRDNTSFLLIHKKQTVLIDCPGSIVHKLLNAGVDFRKLKDVIITHQHPDHIYGIASLIHTQAFLNSNMNIYSNSDCIKIIKKLMTLFRLKRKRFPRINYVNVRNKTPFYSSQGLKITAVKNKHIKNSFGIKAKAGKKTLFYSSDTSFSPELLNQAESADYLIHDCTASSSYFKKHPILYKLHTCAKDLSEYMNKNSRAKLIPIHFLLLDKGEERRIKQELSCLKRKVIFPKDFQQIPF